MNKITDEKWFTNIVITDTIKAAHEEYMNAPFKWAIGATQTSRRDAGWNDDLLSFAAGVQFAKKDEVDIENDFILTSTIENISAVDFRNGYHTASGDNTIAIQITDPCGWIARPKAKFAEIHNFDFLDIDNPYDASFGEFAITEKQAGEICDILIRALNNNMNIVVHCTPDNCRSSAVTEVGSIMGFKPINNRRIPNVLVKKLMMGYLGLTYDASDIYFSADTTADMKNMV